ncbi:MAG TPA: MFS transporter [Microscillaceae bacterium]|nr:MFS transporter [Microscillaceae bacterium]
MIQKALRLYREAYAGLSLQIWLLAGVMLINRAGSMVVPFMTLYFTQELHFSMQQAGFIISAYGVGSTIGSLLGGRLTDKLGYFKVQFLGLFLGGFLLFVLVWMRDFYAVVACTLVLSMVADMFRPANSAAVAAFSDVQNRTRAYSLNRLAINLGFSISPALGGFLAAQSFSWLFWVDGVTCWIAALILFLFLRNAPETTLSAEEETETSPQRSAYQDRPFLFFIFLTVCFAIAFMQVFMLLPLYLKQQFQLPEWYIGLVISANGLLVALLEMVIVFRVEGYPRKLKIVSRGLLWLVAGYLLLALNLHYWTAWLFILLITIAEMLAMPFMSTFTIERATVQNRGQYAALYNVAYALGYIFAPSFGAYMASTFGFVYLWMAAATIALFTFGGFRILERWVRHEKAL